MTSPRESVPDKIVPVKHVRCTLASSLWPSCGARWDWAGGDSGNPGRIWADVSGSFRRRRVKEVVWMEGEVLVLWPVTFTLLHGDMHSDCSVVLVCF